MFSADAAPDMDTSLREAEAALGGLGPAIDGPPGKSPCLAPAVQQLKTDHKAANAALDAALAGVSIEA
jgi:hypothetical protein